MSIPVFGREVVALIFVRDVQPSVFVFEYFADGAAFYAKDCSNVFLTGIWMLQVVDADGLAVLVAQFVLVVSLSFFGAGGGGGLEWIAWLWRLRGWRRSRWRL